MRSFVLFGALVYCFPIGSNAEFHTTSQPDLAQQIQSAQPLKIEQLTQPASTTRFESPIGIENKTGGPDILQIYYKGYQGPATAYVFDTNTRNTTRSEIPQGRNVHLPGKTIAENGSFYTTLQKTGGGIDVWKLDPTTDKMESVLEFGEDLKLLGQINRLVSGDDGHLYGTVSSKTKGAPSFYQINTQTDTVKILGFGPKQSTSTYAVNLVYAPNGKLYSVYGKTPFRLIEFNPGTGDAKELATAAPSGGFNLLKANSNTVQVTVTDPLTGYDSAGTYNLFGQSQPVEATNPKQRYISLIKAGYSPGEAKALAMSQATPNFSAPKLKFDTTKLDPLLNQDRKGLLRYRNSNSEPWLETTFDPPSYGEAIRELVALPDGRIFGTAANRSGHFVYHPDTGETTFLGRTHIEQNTAIVSNNHLYFSGYPSGIVWQWNYTDQADWQIPQFGKSKTIRQFATTDPDANPRQLGALRDLCGIHRTTCSAVDSQGRVFFGGQWYRDGNGGGLAWWDQKHATSGGFWKPFSALQITDLTHVTPGDLIVVSNRIVPDHVLNNTPPESATLAVVDSNANPSAIARSITPVPGAVSTGLITSVGNNRVIGIMPDPESDSNWLLYGVAIDSGTTLFRKTIPGQTSGKTTSNDVLRSYRSELVTAPDGSVWFNHGGTLLKINPDNAHVEVIGSIKQTNRLDKKTGSETLGRLTFSGDDIYLSGSRWLRRISR